ncbi:biliverdin-producing heme oxygenase [Hymenobacter cellulosilyticus]|uniref:Biliverdin-producing heme oxygenase n=1 Tax=Hymenobacter cellulosilyticus TaxID=2932248 RepID=A0A8T9Q9R4_9BACT|nr:biliverdin-producing heme oxygenase [Hymenobacter cellulosilyticus]UOQ73161.1 biliverdin-producing heme oxygenase [Hymenobacter cellulosilyticus]
MPTTLHRPAILEQLRTETRPYHDALEQNKFNQMLQQGTVTEAVTRRFLAKLYGFLVPYEARLRQLELGPEWQVEQRLRAHLIPQDLGVAAAELPLCLAMPELGTRAQLLGAMYVLEGSTLGGQVLARQLAKAGIESRTYFMGNGDQTGPLWKSFCQLLAEAATEDNQAQIVASAASTFQTLHAWIEKL